MYVTYSHSETTAKNIRTFYFKPDRSVRYIAGQFIELYLPHDNPDKRGTKHWFTLSSAPLDDLLSITTKFATGKSSTFKQTLAKLEPGTELKMASPMGDFVLPKDDRIPLIFVAAGIGCTPFHSIIRELQLTKEERDITLLYAANHPDDIAFHDTFDRLGDRFITLITSETPDWPGPTGPITAQSIMDLTKPRAEHYIYISGPEPLVENLTKDLKKLGIDKHHIHTDYFPNYPADL